MTPAGDHIKPFIEFRQQCWDIARIVLQIGTAEVVRALHIAAHIALVAHALPAEAGAVAAVFGAGEIAPTAVVGIAQHVDTSPANAAGQHTHGAAALAIHANLTGPARPAASSAGSFRSPLPPDSQTGSCPRTRG